ncbi:hypothetical protein [Pedosphaera parvula]|uniref:Glycoside hydrolase family 42 N-terminal domain-containing protein n=1 Tax=Pedosphaera parvula (strain Ellin514) TaxID=320771 RepID=B9XKU4_PEDPL|nr:hypothetical protein [Pedosphaera parvula]EEF59587.1 hypothetical protein Cflav_PD2494 [Pedosphaera parvula Ellin514]
MKGMTRRTFLENTALGIGGALMSAPFSALAKSSELTTPVFTRDSFSFLHTYEATGRYWRGLERSGLLRRTNGIRLVNSPWATEESRFNSTARIGGELNRILKKRRCQFIVDRVTGGSHYNSSDYNQSLVEAYMALLGVKFLGGQVHETVCNTHNDWDRFVSANKKFRTEPVSPEELRSYFTCKTAPRCLEYGTLDDYAGRVHPKDAADFWREIERNFHRQSERFGSRASYCEGSANGERTWHQFYKFGARRCIAELGPWASSKSQFAIASLRGAARAAGKPWGIFYAPWGPEGCTAMVPEKEWSWQCPLSFFEGTGWPMGPERGPSSALQRRMFFHAYLSGAWTLHEEWGAECNLLDWESARLSSYGRVTEALLDFQEKHPDVGEPYTPLALALDARVPTPDAALWMEIKKGLFQSSAEDARCAARKNSGIAEADCYAPCVVPEIFDIVPSDASEKVWTRYQEAIQVGAGTHPNANVFPQGQQLTQIIASAKKLSPFERSTHLPMQINHRHKDGAWILGFYNPWGARRGDVENVGSLLDDGCAQRDTLRATFLIKSAKVLHAWPPGTGMARSKNSLEIVVGPGGTLILEVIS